MSDEARLFHRLIFTAQRFISVEVASGGVLLAAAVVALIWANSPWDEEYFDLFGTKLTVDGGIFRIDESLQHWINDGLMTLFFFVVGLEIKRELVKGELAGFQKALLPAVAAIGGMVVPALLYTALNAGGDGSRGWGVPMATDIAFALGVLALVGSRIPSPVRVFLLALAIVDDIGAILVIALFYTGDVSIEALLVAGFLFGVVYGMTRLSRQHIGLYLLVGAAIWLAMYESGIHATIAGVVVGLMTPTKSSRPDAEPPLDRLEDLLHPVSSFLIVPLFALANAGVIITGDSVDEALSSEVSQGIVLGLLLGKPIGIFLATWLVVQLRIGKLPDGMGWDHVLGVGLLGGVGFTVALFVNELAFDEAALINDGKMGILAGSILSAIAGLLILTLITRRDQSRGGSETQTEAG